MGFFDKLLRREKEENIITKEQDVEIKSKELGESEVIDRKEHDTLSNRFKLLMDYANQRRALESEEQRKKQMEEQEKEKLKNDVNKTKLNETFTMKTNGLGQTSFEMLEEDKKYITYNKYWRKGMEYYYKPMLCEERESILSPESDDHKSIYIETETPVPKTIEMANKLDVIVSRLKSHNNDYLFNELYQMIELDKLGYTDPRHYDEDLLIDHMYDICKNTSDSFFELGYQEQLKLLWELGHEEVAKLCGNIELGEEHVWCTKRCDNTPFKREYVYEMGWKSEYSYSAESLGEIKEVDHEYSKSVEFELSKIVNSGKPEIEIAIECKNYFETLRPLGHMDDVTQHILLEMNENIDIVLAENAILVNDEWYQKGQSYEIDVNEQVEFSEEYEDRTQ